jgi:hypothetical protein
MVARQAELGFRNHLLSSLCRCHAKSSYNSLMQATNIARDATHEFSWCVEVHAPDFSLHHDARR